MFYKGKLENNNKAKQSNPCPESNHGKQTHWRNTRQSTGAWGRAGDLHPSHWPRATPTSGTNSSPTGLSLRAYPQELLHLRAWNNFGGLRHPEKVKDSPWPCRMVKCSSNSQNPPAWCGACRSWGGHLEHISCRQRKNTSAFNNLVAEQSTTIQQPQDYSKEIEVGAQKPDLCQAAWRIKKPWLIWAFCS